MARRLHSTSEHPYQTRFAVALLICVAIVSTASLLFGDRSKPTSASRVSVLFTGYRTNHDGHRIATFAVTNANDAPLLFRATYRGESTNDFVGGGLEPHETAKIQTQIPPVSSGRWHVAVTCREATHVPADSGFFERLFPLQHFLHPRTYYFARVGSESFTVQSSEFDP